MPDDPASPTLLSQHKGKLAATGGIATLAAILVPLVECYNDVQKNRQAIDQTQIHYVSVDDWNSGRKADLEQTERLIRMALGQTNR